MKNFSCIIIMFCFAVCSYADVPQTDIDADYNEFISPEDLEAKIDSIKILLEYDIPAAQTGFLSIYKTSAALFDKTKLKKYKELSLLAAYNYGIAFSKERNFSYAIHVFNLVISDAVRYDFYDIVSMAYGGLGLVYFHLELIEKAESFFLRGMKIAEFTNDSINMCAHKCYLGFVSVVRNDLTDAMDIFQEALVFMEKHEVKKGVVICNSNIAAIYLTNGEYEKAEYHFGKVIDFSMSNNFWHECYSYAGLAATYNKLKDYDNAIYYAEKGIQISEEINRLEVLVYANHELAVAYEGKGLLDSANMAYRDYILHLKNLNEKNKVFMKDEAALKEKIKSDYSKIQLEQKHQTEILRKTKLQQFMLVVILLLMIMLVMVVYHFGKKYKNLNKVLSINNDSLNSTNKRLKLSEIKLKESNSIKDKFIAILAHDILTPASSIKMMTTAMAENYHSTDENSRFEDLQKINVEAIRHHEYIESILQWAMLRNGHIDFNPKNLDLGIIAFKVVSFFEHFSNKKNIKIINNIKEGTHVYADFSMIIAVFRNLINNAIKFSLPDSTVLIKSDIKKDEVLVSVVDNGIGMIDDVKQSLFTFNGVKNYDKNTNENKGNGVGLILCKDLVEINGGKIYVESIYGIGSTFSFTLKRTAK